MTDQKQILNRIGKWASAGEAAPRSYRIQSIADLDRRSPKNLEQSGQVHMVQDYCDQLAVGGLPE